MVAWGILEVESRGNINFFYGSLLSHLGNAEDDSKLKKCVSTRYAAVLILLTVKCEYLK